MSPDDRRLRVVAVSHDCAMNLFTNDCVLENLPDDYKVVNAYNDPYSHSICFLIHSMSFDVVPEGVHSPVFMTVQTGEKYFITNKEGEKVEMFRITKITLED